jgi:hypothetical protein
VDQHAFHFVTGENRRQPFRSLGTVELTEIARIASHHFTVHEDDGVQGLILR